MPRRFCFILFAAALSGSSVLAQQPVSLMSPKEAWTFSNGAE